MIATSPEARQLECMNIARCTYNLSTPKSKLKSPAHFFTFDIAQIFNLYTILAEFSSDPILVNWNGILK